MAYKLHFEEEGSCLECGTVFYGRKDKQFCSIGCKNKWHNRQVREQRLRKAEIISELNRNYEVLESLLKAGRVSASLVEMEKAGFNPALVTSHRKGRYRHDEYSCFDICYYRSGTKIFNVRRKAAPREHGSHPFPAPIFRL